MAKSDQTADDEPTPVRVVFDAWIEATGRNRQTKLTPARAQRIKRWLHHYPVEDLVDAVRGISRSQWHVEHCYTGIEHALKNEDAIERYRDAQRANVQLIEQPRPSNRDRPARERVQEDAAAFREGAARARAMEQSGVDTSAVAKRRKS